MSEGNDEERRAIYDQHCEFYRYQDGLMWSRFQTAAIVEGALLYLVYGDLMIAKANAHAPDLEFKALLLAGALLVFVVSVLSLKDRKDAESHRDRMSEFERGTFQTGENWPPSGKALMYAAVSVINLGNLCLLYRRGSPCLAVTFVTATLSIVGIGVILRRESERQPETTTPQGEAQPGESQID